MPSINEYKYNYTHSTATSGGCGKGWAVGAYDYHYDTHKQGFHLDPEHRTKPAAQDLWKSITARQTQWDSNTQYGITNYALQGYAHDYDCYSWGDWYLARKNFIRSFLRPSFDPAFAVIDWPSWSTPLRLAIKDDVINLGATIAEYRQSVSMFGSAVKGVVDAVRSIRKLKFMKRRTLCSVTNAHLIHDYGIAPLMSDMFDTWEALRLRLEQPIYKRYHLSVHPEFKKQERRGPDIDIYGGWVDCSEYVSGKQYITCNVELDREKASMFTLGNPLEIAWEVVPFSFAIDWFIPIGDTLIALDAMKAVKEVHVAVTKKEHRYGYYEYNAVDRNGWVAGGSRPGIYNYNSTEREIHNSVPLPSIPKFSLSGSVNRLLNATSLLVSVRGCKGRSPRFTKSDFGIR